MAGPYPGDAPREFHEVPVTQHRRIITNRRQHPTRDIGREGATNKPMGDVAPIQNGGQAFRRILGKTRQGRHKQGNKDKKSYWEPILHESTRKEIGQVGDALPRG